jgi:hypothetical protein
MDADQLRLRRALQTADGKIKMPIYLFDRSEDGEFSRGDYEMDFANLDEACREALRLVKHRLSRG